MGCMATLDAGRVPHPSLSNRPNRWSIEVPRTDTHSTWLNHDESPAQIVSPSVHQIGHLFADSGSGAGRETQKHDTRRLAPAGMNQLAKVLVFGKENTSFLKGKADY